LRKLLDVLHTWNVDGNAIFRNQFRAFHRQNKHSQVIAITTHTATNVHDTTLAETTCYLRIYRQSFDWNNTTRKNHISWWKDFKEYSTITYLRIIMTNWQWIRTQYNYYKSYRKLCKSINDLHSVKGTPEFHIYFDENYLGPHFNSFVRFIYMVMVYDIQ